MTNPFTDKASMVRTGTTAIIERHLGHPGRIIAMSKSRYSRRSPKHKVYFNGCIYVVERGRPVEVWWGDIDFTKDRKRLQAIANESGVGFYVTPEDP